MLPAAQHDGGCGLKILQNMEPFGVKKNRLVIKKIRLLSRNISLLSVVKKNKLNAHLNTHSSGLPHPGRKREDAA